MYVFDLPYLDQKMEKDQETRKKIEEKVEKANRKDPDKVVFIKGREEEMDEGE